MKPEHKVIEYRLFDGQWMNIVNHAHCWEGYTKEEAVHAAVKMTEEQMAKNIQENKWPAERVKQPVLKDGELVNFTFRAGGKMQFCTSCKWCNVFHKPDKNRLDLCVCNSCGQQFEVENEN